MLYSSKKVFHLSQQEHIDLFFGLEPLALQFIFMSLPSKARSKEDMKYPGPIVSELLTGANRCSAHQQDRMVASDPLWARYYSFFCQDDVIKRFIRPP